MPEAGRTNPDSTLKNVVLPAPFGPIRPQVPFSNTRFIPSSEVTPPYLTVRFDTSIMPVPPLHVVPGRRTTGRPAAARAA